MGLFSNPLGYAGYPPGVTGTPTTQNASIRAATAAEAAAGTLDNTYISPATAQSATALDFASPPVLGFGSTTPRPVHATTLDSTSTTSLGTGAASVINVGVASSTIGFFGATAVAKPASTDDLRTALINLGLYTTGGASPLNLNGGALTVGAITGTTFDNTGDSHYHGDTTGASPAANFIGERLRAVVAQGSAVALTDTVAANVTSVSLTAGVWDVEGIVMMTGGAITGTYFDAAISTTSATLGTLGDNTVQSSAMATAAADSTLTVPPYRIEVAAPTTVYLVTEAGFTVGSAAAYGRISATRVA